MKEKKKEADGVINIICISIDEKWILSLGLFH